jgi:predicted CopG family antitoxin
MTTTTIRISREAQEVLRSLAEQEGTHMQEVLEKAIEAYRRKQLLEMGNRAYAALRSNPKAWEQELAERKLWESTLADGMEKA